MILKVAEIKRTLGDQISLEFREVFSSQAGTMNIKQMSEACLVLDVLEPHIKHDLLQWFVQIQLKEYSVLFEENEDSAWLDKVFKYLFIFFVQSTHRCQLKDDLLKIKSLWI